MDTSMLVRIVLIMASIFVLFALVSYYNSRKPHLERFEAPPAAAAQPAYRPAPAPAACGDAADTLAPADVGSGTQKPNDCYPRDRLTAADLLPKDAANSQWAQVNPAGQGSVADQNFLTAGVHIGIDTIGQSLRNANLTIRPDPPNPQSVVSPWNQSTITPDVAIKSLC